MRLHPAGEAAFLVELAAPEQVLPLTAGLQVTRPRAVTELVPAECTVLVAFDRAQAPAQQIAEWIRTTEPQPGGAETHETAEIDVQYDGEDLDDVARALGTTPAGVVRQHTEVEWTVAFSGFAPGFAYLCPPDGRLDLPRRESPRTRVPAGSVALAAGYTGIYPRASPGGWHLIGRTGALLWDPDRWDDGASPALLQPGMRVRFRAVSELQPPLAPEHPSPEPGTGPRFEVLTAGPLTTVQDLGRPGWAHLGVTGSGAADRGALKLANRLVANDEGAPGLEIMLGGLRLRCVEHDALVAVTGARVPITVNGTPQPDRALLGLAPGDVLEIGFATEGLRAYLAVRGGLDVPRQLGSAATDTLSGLGPPPVQDGDTLTAGLPGEAWPVIDQAPGPSLGPPHLIAVPGPRDDLLADSLAAGLTAGLWTVSEDSDRVGTRLTGTAVALRAGTGQLPSEPVVRGAIQVPPDGQPVLFLADHPVTGGYPVVAVLTERSADRAAQLRPGEQVRITFRS